MPADCCQMVGCPKRRKQSVSYRHLAKARKLCHAASASAGHLCLIWLTLGTGDVFLKTWVKDGALREYDGMRRVFVPVLADSWDLGHEQDWAPAGSPAEGRRQRLRLRQHGAWQESREGRLTRCDGAREKWNMDLVSWSISRLITLGS